MDKKKKIWKIAAVAFASVFVICVVLLILMLKGCDTDFSKYKNETTAETTSDKQTETETGAAETEPSLPDNPIDFTELKKKNNEIYAWIKVPGTQIDYPIVQSLSDDSFYLRRDYLGNYSVSGCIFSQSMNSLDFTDPNTVLYGHYMWDGTFFGGLHNFRDPEFFNNNTEFYIYTEGHILTYEIFAAYEYDSRHILLSFDFSDKKVFEDYLASCLNPTSISRNVREGVALTADNKIVTLSTCVQNSDDNKRYLVQGVLIKDENTK